MSMIKDRNIRLALLGAPNCGKTSLFNALTGGRAKVANYPGVTVEIIRPTEIRAQWTTVQGKVREDWLFGYAGRAFQQKLDQLNGTSMRDHCIPAKWKEAVANAEAKKT